MSDPKLLNSTTKLALQARNKNTPFSNPLSHLPLNVFRCVVFTDLQEIRPFSFYQILFLIEIFFIFFIFFYKHGSWIAPLEAITAVFFFILGASAHFPDILFFNQTDQF